jgi:hypothetical protein
VAQLVAHLHGMQGVRGSSPLSSTGKSAGTVMVPADFFVSGWFCTPSIGWVEWPGGATEKSVRMLMAADWRPAEKCITLVRLLRPIRPEGTKVRGCGAAGSAPAWHAGGQGFESPQLHRYTEKGTITCVMVPFLFVCSAPLFSRRDQPPVTVKNPSRAGQSGVQLEVEGTSSRRLAVFTQEAPDAGQADEEVTDVPC